MLKKIAHLVLVGSVLGFIVGSTLVGIVKLIVWLAEPPKAVPVRPPDPQVLTATRISVCQRVAGTMVQYDNGVTLWFKDPAEAFSDRRPFMRDNSKLLKEDKVLRSLLQPLSDKQRIWIDVSSKKLCEVLT
jgi:hypothetical protein